MAFPEDPRDLIVGMAFGNTQFEDPASLTYEQIAPGPDLDDPGAVLGNVRYERGRIGDAPQTVPTRITFALRNEDGGFSPRNVLGPRYGTLRPGTPTRVSVDVGDGPEILATAFALGFEPITDGPDINPLVPITALGVLNRIGRDQTTRSPLGLAISSGVRLGFARNWWPLEFGTAASPSLISGIPGQAPLTAVSGDALGGADGPPGAAGATDVSGAGILRGALTVDAGSDLWTFKVSAKLGPVTGSATIWQLKVGDLVYAELRITDTPGSELTLDLDDGTSTDSVTETVTVDDDEWHHLSVQISTALSVTSVIIHVDGDTFSTAAAVDFDRPDAVVLAATGELTAVTHAVHYLDLNPNLYQPFLANPDQTAGARVNLVVTAAGLSGGGGAGGASMGLQPSTTIAAIFRECEDADESVFGERRNGRILHHLNEDRYNRSVAWELDYEDVTDLLMGDDDRDTYNVITVTDNDGNVGLAEESNGPVGSDTTTGIGPRPFPATRNLFDPEDLRHHAGWLLRKGTVDKPRYIVVLDLFANPGLIGPYVDAATGSMEGISYRITIDGAPSEDHGPDLLDLIVEGEIAELGPDRWRVQLFCESYEPWNVRELNEDTDPDSNPFAGRWAEEEGTVLDEAIDADDASFDVDVAGGAWTQDADEFDTDLGVGLYIEVGGEVMQVTGIAESGGIWTFTVVRSVNSVSKAHSAGSPLRVVDAQIWAL